MEPNTVTGYTTETLAEKLGISKEAAYALQTFLREAHALRDTGETLKKPGNKGKGAAIYAVNAERMADVCERLKSL